MNRRTLALALALFLTAGLCAAAEAVRELGQPDFRSFIPNRLDGRGLAQPWGVAVDTSRSPNGIWVLDAGNNRVLGWRDVTALRNGLRADVVIGQPDARSNGCNTAGLSAASLCFIESFNGFAYEPGIAVDPDGNLFVADQRNYRVLGYRRPFETDGVADLVIGQARFDEVESPSGHPPSASRIFHPHGLATDTQGNLYATDALRVLEFDRPFETDAVADRVFGQSRLDAFDSFTDPTAPDRIKLPFGIAVDAEGRLYVTDAYSDRVMVWEQPLARQGAADLIFAQGGKTCSFDSCQNVKGIAVEPDGDLWVGSHEQGRIFGYRSPFHGGDTQPDQVIIAANSGRVYDPKPPRDGRPMFAAGGLAIDSTGTLWLADVNRVLGFSDPWHSDGRADRLLGQVRKDQLEANLVDRDGFWAPDAIALDTSADPPHLYVVDSFNHRVLGWADAEGFTDGRPADLILGQPDRWASGCNTSGLSLTSLCLVGSIFHGLAVDARGTVWVSDPGNARVLGYRSPFTSDTVADLVLGGSCNHGRQGMCGPGGLALDKAGNLYVADIVNNRILEFNEPSRRDEVVDRMIGSRHGRSDPATAFSEPNNNHPGLNVYGGLLAVDAQGRLLVGNNGNIYVFEKPLQPRAFSRKLIDLSGTDGAYSLRGLATDAASRIYLSAATQVYRFSRSGAGGELQLGEPCRFSNTTGLPEGLGRASLCGPTGLAVGPGGELFVSDAMLNRVVVFENP